MVTARLLRPVLFSLLFYVALSSPATAQSRGSADIEGRLRSPGGGQMIGLRIRLIKQSGNRQVTETFSRPDGVFTFRDVPAGDYMIETSETADFQSTATTISVMPVPALGPTTIPVLIELPAKSGATADGPRAVAADVDVNVPKAALKHYRAGFKAMESKDSARAMTELKAAIDAFPNYYAARLALGLVLRTEKRFQEAAEIFKQLGQLAPKRAEPHVEYGTILLALGQKEDAARELADAIQLEEGNWSAHFFLGLAILETNTGEAEKHFQRALEIDERKAARAHVALARIAMARGESQIALKHLTDYLALVPNAPDADVVRKHIERLRSKK
jgi:Tfp pilus assembly protein PilF